MGAFAALVDDVLCVAVLWLVDLWAVDLWPVDLCVEDVFAVVFLVLAWLLVFAGFDVASFD